MPLQNVTWRGSTSRRGASNTISLTALGGVLVGLLPAVLAPAPRLVDTTRLSERRPRSMEVAA